MALERTYVVPLRKGWLKAPKYRRTKKAVNTLREFLVRHMKSKDVRILPDLNLELWKHGMKNPPSKVKINVIKDDKGVVKAQLFGKIIEEEKKVEEKKGIMKKLAEKVGKKEEAKPAEPKPAAPAAKPEAAPKVKVELSPKPVVKPVAKPAEKPAAKPEEKPTAPAAEKPAPKAEEPAAEKPAKPKVAKPEKAEEKPSA